MTSMNKHYMQPSNHESRHDSDLRSPIPYHVSMAAQQCGYDPGDHCQDLPPGLHAEEDGFEISSLMHKMEGMEQRVGLIHSHHNQIESRLRDRIDELERNVRHLMKDHGRQSWEDSAESTGDTDNSSSLTHKLPMKLIGDLDQKEIRIQNCLVSRLIGKSGNTIKMIKQKTRVHKIEIVRDGGESRVRIIGSRQAIDQAVAQVQDILLGKLDAVGVSCERIQVSSKSGIDIIGNKGSRVKQLQEQFGVFISVKPNEEPDVCEVEVTGDHAKVLQAVQELRIKYCMPELVNPEEQSGQPKSDEKMTSQIHSHVPDTQGTRPQDHEPP